MFIPTFCIYYLIFSELKIPNGISVTVLKYRYLY
jgi:hypothetical protein